MFRRISVKDKEFLWLYSFDDDDRQNDSIVIVKDCLRKGKLVLHFKTGSHDYGYCPFNKGLAAMKNQQHTEINLNRPSLIVELLTHVLDYRLFDDGFDTTHDLNGIEILKELGYIFDYHLAW